MWETVQQMSPRSGAYRVRDTACCTCDIHVLGVIIYREPLKTCHFSFLGRFLYFLHQWKQEGIIYKQVNKIYHFTLTVSPHYLVKLKPHINSTFWSQSTQCVRSNRLFATFAQSRPMFVFSNFLVRSSFVSLLAEKLSHSQVFFCKKIGLSSNSTYLIVRTNCMK